MANLSANNSSIKIGLSGITVFPITTDNKTTLSYASGTSIPGAISLSYTPTSTQVELYADDILYASDISFGGVDVSLEVAELSTAHKALLFGFENPYDGVITAKANAPQKFFGLAFEVKTTNGKPIRIALKKVKFNLNSQQSYETLTETIAYQTVTIDARAYATIKDGKWMVTIDSNVAPISGAGTVKTAWDTWFTGAGFSTI